MANSKGFTLLEVVVAVVILSVSLTVIIQIYANYIRYLRTDTQQIESIQKVKRYIYHITETDSSLPEIKVETKETKYGISKEIFLIDDNEVLFRYNF